jgi:hypothetical protein
VADPTARPDTTPLPAIHFGILSLRVLFLLFLVLAQTPLLYKSIFVPWSTLHHPSSAESPSERTTLLSSNGSPNHGYGSAEPPKKKRSPLRSSKAPSNRPPDPKSLSILTLFSRIKTLFPYLWPSKSFSLQVIALFCVTLMLLKRVTSVWVPILFGRIISDLSAGRRESSRAGGLENER